MACEGCEHTDWTKLTLDKIVAHLIGYKEDGSDVLGIVPLVERSRSGRGAHVWDNLMRITSSQVAAELLELALGDSRREAE